MTSRLALVLTVLALAGVAGWQATAQQGNVYSDAGEAGDALRRAGQSLATTRAVVNASLLVLMFNFVMSALLFQ